MLQHREGLLTVSFFLLKTGMATVVRSIRLCASEVKSCGETGGRLGSHHSAKAVSSGQTKDEPKPSTQCTAQHSFSQKPLMQTRGLCTAWPRPADRKEDISVQPLRHTDMGQEQRPEGRASEHRLPWVTSNTHGEDP